jgi:hypothetical protein
MQTLLENRKKAATNSPINAHKKKNIVEQGEALGLRVKREKENT